jgi:hypothetical protein
MQGRSLVFRRIVESPAWKHAVVKTRVVIPIFAAVLLLGDCTEVPPRSVVPKPTPQAQSMQRMMADINQMRAYVYGSGTRSEAESAASELVSWSGRMRALFPPGESSAEYVDMSPERARAAPAAMERTATQLLSAVRMDDRAIIGDRLATTERYGCGACHLSSSPTAP